MKRLPSRGAAAPAIFQKVVGTTLASISGVSAFLDYIIISGETAEEDKYRLEQVLTRLEDAGLILKETKSRSEVIEVKLLGHLIN